MTIRPAHLALLPVLASTAACQRAEPPPPLPAPLQAAAPPSPLELEPLPAPSAPSPAAAARPHREASATPVIINIALPALPSLPSLPALPDWSAWPSFPTAAERSTSDAAPQPPEPPSPRPRTYPVGWPTLSAPPPPSRVASLSRVIVYGAEWCGACTTLERALRERGVPFVSVDVDDATAMASAAARPYQELPVGQRGSIPLTRAVSPEGGVRWVRGSNASAVEQAYRGERLASR